MRLVAFVPGDQPVSNRQSAPQDFPAELPGSIRPCAAKEPRKEGPGDAGQGTAVITRTKTQTKKPSMYRVLLLNDDYTPMEFVIHILQKFFNKQAEEAARIMLHVHN